MPHSLLDSPGPQMGLAHQKFLERVTAAGLVVSVVVTSFNPRDHPGRRELGLLHFADVDTEAGERWAGPRWEVAAPPVPLIVTLSTGVGVTTCLPHCLRAGGPRTRPRGWNDSGPRTPAASLELPRRLGLHSSPPPPLTSLSHSPPIVCIPRSPGVRLQPCLSVCPCLSVHVSVTCVWCTVGLVGVSVSVSLCVPLLVMYLSVSVSLHPPLSVHFYLYLALSYLSIQKCLSLVSFLLIRVSPGLSMSLYVSPGQSLPLPLSLSFSGISINPVYYASLLLRTFAFEIAAGGLWPQVALGAAQAPWPAGDPTGGCHHPHPLFVQSPVGPPDVSVSTCGS